MINLDPPQFDLWLKSHDPSVRLITIKVPEGEVINYSYVDFFVKTKEFIVYFNQQIIYKGTSFDAANKTFQMNQKETK